MSDGDHLAGDPMPTGPVPPEPMTDPRIPAITEFLRRNYSIFLQPWTVREVLRVADGAGKESAAASAHGQDGRDPLP